MAEPRFIEAAIGLAAPQIAADFLPDVITFAEHDCHLDLYPRQKTYLRIVFLETENLTDYDNRVIDEWIARAKDPADGLNFPVDIRERMEYCRNLGYPNFELNIACMGRRSGKGVMGGVIGAYKIKQLIALGHPQKYYGLKESSPLNINIVATNEKQAKDFLYNDVVSTVQECESINDYKVKTNEEEQQLDTPNDQIRRMRYANGGQKIGRSLSTIHVLPNAAKAGNLRGGGSYALMFDEMAFGTGGTGSPIDMGKIFAAAQPSVAAFGKDAIIYIPSSPYTKSGKFYDLVQNCFEVDENGNSVYPTYFCLQCNSAELYLDWEQDPTKDHAVMTMDMPVVQSRYRSDPASAKVEYGGQFAETENAYLAPEMVDRIFLPYPNPDFNINDGERGHGDFKKQYRAHGDAAKSQDNFCFALGHKEQMPDGFDHVFIDYRRVWQPTDWKPKDGIYAIYYPDIMDELKRIMKKWSIFKFTFDQFNSVFFIQALEQEVRSGHTLNKHMAIAEETATRTSNALRYERFKTACYLGWVHAPHKIDEITGLGSCDLMEQEAKNLVERNGRIDHQPDSAPVHTNDMMDCISTVVSDLLGAQADAYLDKRGLGMVEGGAQGGYSMDTANAFRAGFVKSAIARGRMMVGDRSNVFRQEHFTGTSGMDMIRRGRN